jgi:hypothetical protein
MLSYFVYIVFMYVYVCIYMYVYVHDDVYGIRRVVWFFCTILEVYRDTITGRTVT